MESKFRDYSQLEMLKDQVVRCDEELLILVKRRLQTCKKMAEHVRKNGKEVEELNQVMEEIYSKALSKGKEMGFEGMIAHDLFGIIDEDSKDIQKKALEKK